MIAIESNGKVTQSAEEGLLAAVLNASRESVLLVDSGTRIVAANTAAREAFERGGSGIENRRLTEVIRDADLHSAIRNALDSGETTELQFELVGSEPRNYDVHVSPLSLGGEQNAIAVFYDITRIEKLERVRQEFLSNISHELRTPLTSILAFVETLEDGAIDDRDNNRRFLATIRRNAERMHALIADILELSLIESGKVSIEKRQVRIANIVDEIYASLSSKSEKRGVALENEVPSDSLVFADAARLEQMLMNLIDNAIKFNRAEGSVSVGTHSEGGRVVITVADTGEGILPEHQHRVFERFYRADRSRAREVGGTGLGLAIVKHLARLHGGEVSVRSRLSEGTVFSIEFPAE
jgi:two-component system phosphate regulon sensor histidine kinase PhoR